MKYKRIQNNIAVRLDVGDDIYESILLLAEKEKISCASVSGIGATDDFTVGVFDRKISAYEKIRRTGDHEIASLNGNISTMDGKPYVHLHLVCADKSGVCFGGHLLSAKISLTAEIFVNVADMPLERKHDDTLGINRIKF